VKQLENLNLELQPYYYNKLSQKFKILWLYKSINKQLITKNNLWIQRIFFYKTHMPEHKMFKRKYFDKDFFINLKDLYFDPSLISTLYNNQEFAYEDPLY
jgi:hypothetical protein